MYIIIIYISIIIWMKYYQSIKNTTAQEPKNYYNFQNLRVQIWFGTRESEKRSCMASAISQDSPGG